MTTKQVDSATFANASELADALAALSEAAEMLQSRHTWLGKPVVYVRCEKPFEDDGGVAVLLENRLTDGSRTYDIVLGPAA